MSDAFVFALNAVLPLVLLAAIGYFFKRIKLFNDGFAKVANKAVFRIFLPCMLFLNIYEIDLQKVQITPTYILYTVGAILLVFFAALLTVPLVTKKRERFAPLMQATFRSNYALIGVPLAEAIGGKEGAAIASMLVLATIPTFNILAILLFSVYSEKGERPSIKKTLLEIVKNPLIVSVALGFAFFLLKNLLADAGITTTLSDIPPIYKTLSYLKAIATPLALLVLGIQFEFSAISSMKKELIYGTLARVVIVPAAAIFAAYALAIFTPSHLAAFIGAFATPVAVSTVPMTQEMGGDTELAGQLVVWSTLCSSLSIFLFIFIFRSMGVL